MKTFVSSALNYRQWQQRNLYLHKTTERAGIQCHKNGSTRTSHSKTSLLCLVGNFLFCIWLCSGLSAGRPGSYQAGSGGICNLFVACLLPCPDWVLIVLVTVLVAVSCLSTPVFK